VPPVAQHLEALEFVTPIVFWACIVIPVIAATMSKIRLNIFVKYSAI
jgi:hypothetical protein